MGVYEQRSRDSDYVKGHIYTRIEKETGLIIF